MSKSKKYPDIVGALFSTKIKKFAFFDKSVADALIALGEKVEIYDRRKPSKSAPEPAPLRGEPLTGPAVIRKTCLDGTATLPEPDNAPSEATEANLPIVGAVSKPKKRHRRTKAEWICEECERTFDTPDNVNDAGVITDRSYCPDCGSTNIKQLKPDLPKKRHRRTKAEKDKWLEEMAKQQAAKMRHQEEPDAPEQKDKPKWKCPVCSWEGDNPARIISGPYKNKYECPNCKAIAVKNE